MLFLLHAEHSKYNSQPNFTVIYNIYIAMRGKKYRSKMDLSKGYWQIGMHPNSREATAFITPEGVYEFTRMPFGLKNSAATFNRLMRKVLGDMEGVGCHLCVYRFLE